MALTNVRHFALPIAGHMVATSACEPVHNPFSGAVEATIGVATQADMDDAIAAAVRGFQASRLRPAFQRKSILSGIAAGL